MEKKEIFKLVLRVSWLFFIVWFGISSTASYFTDSVKISGNTFETGEWANAGKVLINEIYADPIGSEPDEEWMEIYNSSNQTIDLSGYKIGDEETQFGGEGMYQFPDGAIIGSGVFLTIANKASAFFILYGQVPTFEIHDTNPGVPNLIKYSDWATGSINLSNSGDEILLLNSSNLVIDAVVYGSGVFGEVIPHPCVVSGSSLERSPAGQDSDNCATDFIEQTIPTPGLGI